LPGIIGDRLFTIFDQNGDGYLDLTEFASNLFKLYSSEFYVKMKLIFDLYDFDKDGFITRDDAKTLLSHVPLHKKINENPSPNEGLFTQSGGGFEDYTDRCESQEELNNLIEICFEKEEKLNFEKFKKITESVSSEMFLCIFSMLKTHFAKFDQFKRYEQGKLKEKDKLVKSPSRSSKLATPKVLTRFSQLSHLVLFSTPKLGANNIVIIPKPDINLKTNENGDQKNIKLSTPSPPKGHAMQSTDSSSDTESPINLAIRFANCSFAKSETETSPKTPAAGGECTLFCECGKEVSDYGRMLCADCLIKKHESNCQGYLYKKSKKEPTKLKKYWFCIENRELFCIF